RKLCMGSVIPRVTCGVVRLFRNLLVQTESVRVVWIRKRCLVSDGAFGASGADFSRVFEVEGGEEEQGCCSL
ncbi:hypothetical protein HK100_010362, partial [Physocladia obscura]